jgi:hypothetical protein
MTDIIDRLRNHVTYSYVPSVVRACMDDAAKEIERLRAGVDRISDLFGDAVQADCENGVRCLNERAAKRYLAEFPATLAAIREAQDIADQLTLGETRP